MIKFTLCGLQWFLLCISFSFSVLEWLKVKKYTISMTFCKIVNFTFLAWELKKTEFLKSVGLRQINILPKKEPFAELESHIKPLALARLSAVAPLIKWNMKVNQGKLIF